jgi:hypothetical protein
MTGVNEKKLWSWLRTRGAEHHAFNINGKNGERVVGARVPGTN